MVRRERVGGRGEERVEFGAVGKSCDEIKRVEKRGRKRSL